MARVLFVEDELIYGVQLERMLTKTGHQIVASLTDCETLLEYLPQTDIILLDIHIGGEVNGLDCGEEISKYNIPIIFITQFEEPTLYQKSLHIPHSAFLIKPFHQFTLDRTIQLLLEKKDNEPINYIKNGRDRNILKTGDVLWIKVEGNYTYIMTKDKYYVFKKSLAQLKQSLHIEDFVQVHRNYIIPIDKIDQLNLSDNFILIGNEKIPLSRRYKKSLMSYLKRIF